MVRRISFRPIIRFLFLEIYREINVCDPTVAERLTAGEIRHVLYMGDSHHPGAIERNVRKDAIEVDILLRVSVDEIVEMMPGQSQHRLAVQLRVVEPIEQVDPTRA